MLSMPRGTDPLTVQRAAREFAQIELADHKYVMVLHDHQANPHVHISVRAESKHGKRLNPRKADLHRWRETFAEKLRGQGVEAEATRQATRGRSRNYDPCGASRRARTVDCAPAGRVPSRVRMRAPRAPKRSRPGCTWAGPWPRQPTRPTVDLARSISAFVKEMPSTTPSTEPSRAPEKNSAFRPIDMDPRR